MNQSVYPLRSQELHHLFEEAEHRKILVVPIDFAKVIHEAQLCRGTGQYLLRKPLRVHNSLCAEESGTSCNLKSRKR